jgi:hypothetical protein
MKLLKWFGVIILVIVSLYLLSETGPIRSAYSKKILLSDPIVPQLNANCTYFKPSRFLSTTNPHLSCITTQRFNEDQQVIEIERLQRILESNGWKVTEKYHPRAVTLRKDKFRFSVQPYHGEPGLGRDEDPRLIIYFGHLTLADYGN